MLVNLKQYWWQLAARERLVVGMLTGLLLVVLLDALIWSPIHDNHERAERQLLKSEAEWRWLSDQVNTHKDQLGHGTSPVQTNSAAVLMSHIQQQLKQANIYASLSSIKPTNRGIKVEFESVSSPKFFSWLSALEQMQMSATRMNITPVKTGWIKAQVEFSSE